MFNCISIISLLNLHFIYTRTADLLASWPPGLLASWPPGLLASWPPGLLASWPPGLLASKGLAARGRILRGQGQDPRCRGKLKPTRPHGRDQDLRPHGRDQASKLNITGIVTSAVFYIILAFPADIGRAGFAGPWEPAIRLHRPVGAGYPPAMLKRW